jgi:magnesium transporter
VNLTLVSLSQNEEVKSLTQASIAQADEVKMISTWAAILFASTLVSAVYGMNFDHMPELHWPLGYPFALALMLVVSRDRRGCEQRRAPAQRPHRRDKP